MPKTYYWFAKAGGKLGYGDGRTPRVGRTHRVDVTPVLCVAGLHASPTPLAALEFAGSSILYGVHLSGEIVHGDDKSTATERTYIWRMDATHILRAFARRCALDVIHLWDAPEVTVRYLRTGDQSLRAAALAAARAAAWDAALFAAWAAAWDAARARQSRRLLAMIRKAR